MKDFLTKFITQYYKDPQRMRIGQMFVNLYISQPWPELFYEEDDAKAIEMIGQWLRDNQYVDHEPPKRK